MFKNIYYDNKNKKIKLCETYNGKDVESEEDFYYNYYVPDGEKKSEIKDIHNNPVVLQKTQDKNRFKMLKGMGLQLYESDINEEVQYLQHRYRDVELKPDIKDFNIAYMDIEVESGSKYNSNHKIKIRKKP